MAPGAATASKGAGHACGATTRFPTPLAHHVVRARARWFGFGDRSCRSLRSRTRIRAFSRLICPACGISRSRPGSDFTTVAGGSATALRGHPHLRGCCPMQAVYILAAKTCPSCVACRLRTDAVTSVAIGGVAGARGRRVLGGCGGNALIDGSHGTARITAYASATGRSISSSTHPDKPSSVITTLAPRTV